jgi:hypothetical protein
MVMWFGSCVVLSVIGSLFWWLWTRGYYRFTLILDDFLYTNLKDQARERVYAILFRIVLVGYIVAALAIIRYWPPNYWPHIPRDDGGLLFVGLFFGGAVFFGMTIEYVEGCRAHARYEYLCPDRLPTSRYEEIERRQALEHDAKQKRGYLDQR